jgi:hypothetical protein
VRGEFLVGLLSGQPVDRALPHASLKVSGAHVVGDVDLEGAVVDIVVSFESCVFEGYWHLGDAELRGLRLRGSTIQGMKATNLRVRGNLEMNDGFEARTKVDLMGAHVAGDFRLTRSRWHPMPDSLDLDEPKRVALLASRLRVDGGMLARGIDVDGQLRMIGARIGGLLSFAGGQIRNPGFVALQAERVHVGESIFFQQGFQAAGRVILQNSTIDGGIDASRSMGRTRRGRRSTWSAARLGATSPSPRQRWTVGCRCGAPQWEAS